MLICSIVAEHAIGMRLAFYCLLKWCSADREGLPPFPVANSDNTGVVLSSGLWRLGGL